MSLRIDLRKQPLRVWCLESQHARLERQLWRHCLLNLGTAVFAFQLQGWWEEFYVKAHPHQPKLSKLSLGTVSQLCWALWVATFSVAGNMFDSPWSSFSSLGLQKKEGLQDNISFDAFIIKHIWRQLKHVPVNKPHARQLACNKLYLNGVDYGIVLLMDIMRLNFIAAA